MFMRMLICSPVLNNCMRAKSANEENAKTKRCERGDDDEELLLFTHHRHFTATRSPPRPFRRARSFLRRSSRTSRPFQARV